MIGLMRGFGFLLLSVLIATVICGPAIYVWDSNRNRGFLWGYYGDFNAISNELGRVPGVTITNYWYDPDISLEEMSFDLTVQGEPVRIFLEEEDPIRRLRKDALSNAAVLLIETEMQKAKR